MFLIFNEYFHYKNMERGGNREMEQLFTTSQVSNITRKT